MLRFKFTRVSSNAKTGPIPTVLVARGSCPPSCPLYTGGCYALAGAVRIHWNRTTEDGGTFEALLADIRKLPAAQNWRYGVAGDLPGEEEFINPFMMASLVAANAGRPGWAYTHKSPLKASNAAAIRSANKRGFTVNLSSNNLAQADEYLALGIGPVVTIIPSDFVAEKVKVTPISKESRQEKEVIVWRNTKTPGGALVVQCPAEYKEGTQCVNCGGSRGPLCARSDRDFVVGFTTHGVNQRKANIVAKGILPVLQ